jgi:hypothetical protein
VGRAVWVESGALAGRVVWVESEAQVGRAVWVELTVPRLCPLELEAMHEATGLITLHIAAALPIRTGRRQTGLAAVLAEIRWPNARRAPGSRSHGKVEISPAGRPRRPVVCAAPAVWASPIEPEAPGPQIALHARVLVPAEPIASGPGIFRVAVARETAMHSAAVPGDSTALPPAVTAAVAGPSVVAADLAAGESVAAEARGAVAAGAAEAVVAVEAAEGAVAGKRCG